MRRSLFTLLGAIASTAAGAADISGYPAKAPYLAAPAAANWSGLYVSGYGLYGANLTNTDAAAITNAAGGCVNTGCAAGVSGVAGDLASAPHGPGIGGSFGYNYQLAPNGLVLGIRADIAYANLQGGGTVSGGGVAAACAPNCVVGGIAGPLSVSNATNYLGDFDVLLGLPLGADGRLLAYGVGGFAYGGAKPNLAALGTSTAISDTSTGWNVGLGLAYQLSPNWQLYIEGDYFQLGDKSLTLTDGSGNMIATSLTKYHIFEQKFGISYKFAP